MAVSTLAQIRKLKDLAQVVELLKNALVEKTNELKETVKKLRAAERKIKRLETKLLKVQRELEDIKAILSAPVKTPLMIVDSSEEISDEEANEEYA